MNTQYQDSFDSPLKQSPLWALFIVLLFILSCSTVRPGKQQNDNSTISSIENNLFSIGQTGTDSGVAQSVTARMNALMVPGMSIAVFDKGHIIWARGYGLRNKELGQGVDTTTIFQAASISKPVTSVAAFRLVNKGLLQLDEDVNTYLKKWKVPENEFTVHSKVTARGIVSHMAGLSVHGFYGYGPNDSIPTTLQILDGLPPANSAPVRVFMAPNTKEFYSGGGFTILQLLIEEVTGKTFSGAMNELILKPLEMSNSFFSLRVPPEKKSNTATGYRSKGEMVDGGYHIHPEQAAAGLWTTPSDLARFMMAVGDCYRGTSATEFLPQTMVKEMLTKIPGGGGLGFGIDGRNDSLRFRHSGGNDGYTCYAVSFAQTGRGVVIMTNGDNGTILIREFLRSISRAYKWPPMWPRE